MTQFEPVPFEVEALARRALKCAFRVHTELGPGLLESVYQAAMAYELSMEGLLFQSQPGVIVRYKGIDVGEGLRPDFIVEGCLILELKSVDEIHPIHVAQGLTYLKLTGCRLGLILNFNVVSMKEGIKRLVR